MLTNDRSLRIAIWIIALSLAAIALKPIARVEDARAGQSPVGKILGGLGQAQQQKSTTSDEPLAGTAESGRIVPFGIQGGGAFWAYDRETLALYIYDTRDGQCSYLGKLTQLGKPLDQNGVRQIPFLR